MKGRKLHSQSVVVAQCVLTLLHLSVSGGVLRSLLFFVEFLVRSKNNSRTKLAVQFRVHCSFLRFALPEKRSTMNCAPLLPFTYLFWLMRDRTVSARLQKQERYIPNPHSDFPPSPFLGAPVLPLTCIPCKRSRKQTSLDKRKRKTHERELRNFFALLFLFQKRSRVDDFTHVSGRRILNGSRNLRSTTRAP